MTDATTAALGALSLADDAPLQDAVRLSLVEGDVTAFRRALETHRPDVGAHDAAAQLVFLMDWFHRWQQEYEAFAEVLEAELADADEDEAEDEEDDVKSIDGDDDADNDAVVEGADADADTSGIQFVEKDLEDLEAEAHEVFKGFSAVAVELLEALGDVSSDTLLDKHGWTLLMQAANSGLRELTDALIARGVNVNYSGTEKEGTTPLYLALSSDHTNEAMALLKNGAIASATKVVRSSLEPDAAADGETADSDRHVEEDCAWFQACRLGQLAVIEEMIALGVDVNFALPTSGERALHVAVMFEMQDVVELLVANEQIKVNAKNKIGQTCLFGCSNVELVQYLVLKAGVDVRVKDDDDETAFTMAKELGDDEVAAFLQTRSL